jgi:hypothetical protein
MLPQEDVFTQLHEPISVTVQFHPEKPRIRKLSFVWKDRLYEFRRVTGYYEDKQGETLVHVLAVAGYGKCFTLALHTKSLKWYVEEVYERYRPCVSQPKQVAQDITRLKAAYSRPEPNGASPKR